MAAEAAAKLAPEEPILLVEQQEGIARLTLNRPKQYNVLSKEMLAALTATFTELAKDDGLRVVVLGAQGKAFCAGHDLKQMRATPDQAYYQRLFDACSEMMQSVLKLPVPVIARVQGIATAAGCQLVATCDLAVAAESARFATSGINAGLFCSTPAVALTRNVPMKPAFEMLVTGAFVDAPEAKRLGLVNRVAPDEMLDAAVEELVQQIASKSTVAVRTGKRLFYRQLEQGIGDAYRHAAEVMACNMMAEDVGEGIDAFIEKRKPVWRHR